MHRIFTVAAREFIYTTRHWLNLLPSSTRLTPQHSSVGQVETELLGDRCQGFMHRYSPAQLRSFIRSPLVTFGSRVKSDMSFQLPYKWITAEVGVLWLR
jgi:hypothetical protein